jgi:glycosyltransferase involved in cell wall biosynthesis
MKICLLIDAWKPIWGGGQVHTWMITNKITQKYDCKIHIYTRSLINAGVSYEEDESYNSDKIKIFRIGPKVQFFNIFGRLIWNLTVIIAVLRAHRKQKYDLIHAHAYLAGFPAKVLGLLIHRKVIFTVHGANNLDLHNNSLAGVIESVLLTKIKYDQVVSVSKHFLAYPNINSGIKVIPNGVEINRALVRLKKSKKDEFIILWVGRFDPVKGIENLLDAFSKLVIKYKNVRLRLIGSGGVEKSIRKLAAAMKITNYVKFMGSLYDKDLISEYLRADFFCLPSLSEGQSVTILEAAAARLPVITTDVGDNGRLVRLARGGYVVAPNNSKQLLNALDNAINTRKVNIMGNNLFNYVEKHFSWEKSAAEYYKLYKRLGSVA